MGSYLCLDMRCLYISLCGLLLWGQTSPSWGRAQIDSATSIIPAYIVSPVAQTNTRLPYFAVVHVTGLEPNTWYRYVPRMDNATTPPSSNNINLGAGNPIFYNLQTNSYRLVTTPSFTLAGGYDTVLTDGNGEATLIFGIQPTANARFRTDVGNVVYVKVFFRSHDTSGPIDSAYVIGDKTPIRPLALRTTCPLDTCGSFLYDSSLAAAGTLVFLYDEYGPHQVGERPLAGAVVEPVGITWGGSQLAAYTSQVSTQQKRYGTLIPNHTTRGVRAIHYVDPQRPSLECEQAIFDTNGVWPSGISTVNPSNGPAPFGLLNSPVYPLPPDPGNSCLSLSSGDIDPVTGDIDLGYTIQPTEGFLFDFSLSIGAGPTWCVGSGGVPVALNLADSTSPSGNYFYYELCNPSVWGNPIDTLYGWIWPSMSTPCEPCIWYVPVQGTFYWRCFRGEAGYLVQNFTYAGDETQGPPYTHYDSVNVMLSTRLVPNQVSWTVFPPSSVEAGDPLFVSAVLTDLVTASWGFPSGPDFTGCTFPQPTLHILTANGAPVATIPGNWGPIGVGLPTMTFGGTWPSTPGQYKVVIDAVPFPSCGCGSVPGGWAASDTILVTINVSTGLMVRTEATHWTLSAAEGQASLYDAQGRLLWQSPVSGEAVIPRYALPSGIYTLVWRGKDRTTTRKLLHLQP